MEEAEDPRAIRHPEQSHTIALSEGEQERGREESGERVLIPGIAIGGEIGAFSHGSKVATWQLTYPDHFLSPFWSTVLRSIEHTCIAPAFFSTPRTALISPV